MRPQVVLGALTLAFMHPGPRAPLRVIWRGKSESPAPAQMLGPHLHDALANAAALGVSIELRFEELDYINSSSLGVVAQFIRDCRSKRVKLAIVFDAERKWQRLSFDALRVFDTGDGSLEFRPVAR